MQPNQPELDSELNPNIAIGARIVSIFMICLGAITIPFLFAGFFYPDQIIMFGGIGGSYPQLFPGIFNKLFYIWFAWLFISLIFAHFDSLTKTPRSFAKGSKVIVALFLALTAAGALSYAAVVPQREWRLFNEYKDTSVLRRADPF